MRTVFILGGGGDIGKAFIKRFEIDHKVIAPSRAELDLSDFKSIDKYFSKIQFESIDVLINCAGINFPARLENLTIEDIEKTYRVNALSFVKVVQCLLPYLKEKQNAYILAVSSIYGTISRIGRLPYAMSKHAINGMIKTLALELGQDNVKVNAISPGFVNTKLTRQNNDAATIEDLKSRTALNRLAEVEDIANVAYFLCSDENQYITGQNIIVDGGYCIGGFQK